MTIIEKILASHSIHENMSPGNIIDIEIDIRVARDFGGANVVKSLKEHGLTVADPGKTLFTFDCNPTGSDQKYAANQQLCRIFARENGIRIYDIDAGIGTHLLIDEGYISPGMTAVSTDSHANILGAIGAFGQGMGDMDITSAWNKGKLWFKVPPSVRIDLYGAITGGITAKDIALNLIDRFGPDTFLGCSVEIFGRCIDKLTLDQRMTIASMATEMGAVIIFFPPSVKIDEYCSIRSSRKFTSVNPDPDAEYLRKYDINASGFIQMISFPGAPHNTVPVGKFRGTKIDSAFIGSCTNGRMEDMQRTADILKGRKVAPGVILKIVPSTDRIWKKCLDKGLIEIFKEAGALVSNAGCAGCAAGQIGQNGPGEVTISTGNRNFPGKQGKGDVYLASPDIVAASAVAGYITTPDKIPETPAGFVFPGPSKSYSSVPEVKQKKERPDVIRGKARLIYVDNIDTDMIYHNKYLTITNISEMGKYVFDNLKGFGDFSGRAEPGDIIVTGRNFGCGSSRQQAVDCFMSLGIGGIIAESFGSIYERNAINAALPVFTCKTLKNLDLQEGDLLEIDMRKGIVLNKNNGKHLITEPVSEVQLEIYKNGGLL